MADFTFRTDVDFGGAQAKADALIAKLGQVEKTLGKKMSLDVDAGKGAAGVQKLTDNLGRARTATGQFASAQKSAGDATAETAKTGTREWPRLVKVIDDATDEVKQYDTATGKAATATASLGGSAGKLGGLNTQLGGVGGKLSGMASAVPALGGLTSGITGMAGAAGPLGIGLGVAAVGLKKVIDIGGEFQDQVADMRSIIGATAEEADQLGDRARELGKKWGIEATQGVETFKLTISALGPEVAKDQDALQSMADSILTFAKAGGVDGATATNALTVTLSQFGFASLDAAGKAKKMAEISNILAAAAQEGSAEIPDLAESMKVAGATAAGANISIAETAAALELLAPAGIKGAEAGTAVRNMILRMSTGTKKGADALKGMGLAFDDINPEKNGLEKSLQTLKGGFEKITDPVQRAAAMSALFGLENANAASLLLESSGSLGAFTEKITGTSVAQEQAAIKMDTFNAKMGKLKVGLEDVAIQIFDALEPAFSAIIDVLITIADVIGPVLSLIGELYSIVFQLIAAVWEAGAAFVDWLVNLKPVQAAITYLSNAAKNVWSALKNLASILAGAAVRAWQAFVRWVREAAEWLGNKLQPIVRSIASFFRGVWNGIMSLVARWWKSHVIAVKTLWSWLKNLAYNVLTLGGRFTGLVNIFKDVGKWISWLVGKIGGVVRDIANFLGLLGDAEEKAGGGGGGQHKFMGGLLESMQEVVVEGGEVAIEVGEEVGESLGEGFEKGSEKAATVAKKEILDFIETVRSALESARAARFEVFVGGLTDEEEIIRANGTERRRAIESEYDADLRSIAEKLAEAEKKKLDAAANKEVLTIEIKNLEAARKALAEKRSALIDQQLTEEQRQVQENRLKLLETELKADAEAVKEIMDRRKALREAQIGLIDESTIVGIRDKSKLELEGLAQDYTETARKIAAESPEYERALAAIQEQVAAGAITAFEGTIQANEALSKIAVEQQKQTGSLINLTWQKYQKDRQQITADAKDKEIALEVAARRNENAIFAAALKFKEGLFKSFLDKIKGMRQKDNEEEKKENADKISDLRKQLADGSIGRAEFSDQLAALSAEYRATQTELTGSTSEFLKIINAGVSSGFALSLEGMKTVTDAANTNLQALFTHTTEQVEAMSVEMRDELGITTQDTWQAMANVGIAELTKLGAAMGQFAVDGKNVAIETAHFALDLLAANLEAVAKVIAAKIFGVQVAELGIAGIATAAGLTVAFMGLVGVAKAALSGGFKDGGWTSRGNRSGVAGVVHHEEHVIKAPFAGRHIPFLDMVNKGVHPLVAAVKIYGPGRIPAMPRMERSRAGAMVDTDLLREVRSLRLEQSRQAVRTETAIREMAREIDIRRTVDVTGTMEMDTRTVTATIEKSKKLSGRGY